jgi:ABC-type polysaccharide/polyol phosphate transport system ATPase subunit
MSSDDPKQEPEEDNPAVDVCKLTKCYELWSSPAARLSVPLALMSKSHLPHFLHPRIDRFVDDNRQQMVAVDGVSFSISRGESVGIIGRNGSGKSTLLRMLAGTLQSTSGDMSVHGRLSALLELGTGFNVEYTGRENVIVSGAILGFDKRTMDHKMEFIESFADLGVFMDRPVRTYSSGMYLRLAFAVAISVSPDILIVDEALAVGDVFFQQKCFRYMREELSAATRILVTHSMQAVTSLCDRVLILSSGKLVFDGDPLEGIALYTKEMHNAMRKRTTVPLSSTPSSDHVVKHDARKDKQINWEHVAPDAAGGMGNASITAYNIAVNGEQGAGVVRPGDKITVIVSIHCIEKIDKGIIGYLMRDRTGTAIFAENTLGFLRDALRFAPGVGTYKFEFVWPDVLPGNYFLTVGVGQGEHALQHDVECWAQNVAVFESIQGRVPVHAIFNNPLTAFESIEDRTPKQNDV